MSPGLEIRGIEKAIREIELEVLRLIDDVIEPGMRRAWSDLYEAFKKYIPQYTRNAYEALTLDLSNSGEVRIFMAQRGPYDPASTDYIVRIASPHTSEHTEYPGWRHGRRTVYTNPNALPGDEWIRKAMSDIGLLNPRRTGDGAYTAEISDEFKRRYFGVRRPAGFQPPFA